MTSEWWESRLPRDFLKNPTYAHQKTQTGGYTKSCEFSTIWAAVVTKQWNLVFVWIFMSQQQGLVCTSKGDLTAFTKIFIPNVLLRLSTNKSPGNDRTVYDSYGVLWAAHSIPRGFTRKRIPKLLKTILQSYMEMDRYVFFWAGTDISAIHGPIVDTDISKIFKSWFLLH